MAIIVKAVIVSVAQVQILALNLSFSVPEPGTVEFAHPSFVFKESVGKAMVTVNRANGADGRIQVSWRSEDMTAKNGRDYEGGEGVLVFEHGEIAKAIEIPIYDDQVSTTSHIISPFKRFFANGIHD